MSEPFQEPVSTFDDWLRPTLLHAKGSPEQVVLALLAKGLSKPMHPEDIRLWIKSRVLAGSDHAGAGDVRSQHGIDAESAVTNSGAATTGSSPTLYELVNYGQHWKRLRTAAAEYVLSSPSVTETTTWLYGRLLRPLPGSESLSHKSNLTLRVMTAVVAIPIVKDKKERSTAVLSHRRVAATLNWHRMTSERSCATLREMGVIHKVAAASGVPSRFKMKPLRKNLVESLEPYAESIASLVDGKPDALAAVIDSVTHPAWSYSGTFTHAHWLLLLADTAGIPATTYRMTPAREKSLRSDLDREHINPATAARYLPEILDLIANDLEHGEATKSGEQLTAQAAFDESWAKYRASATARADLIMERQEFARQVFAFLERGLKLHPIPKMPKTMPENREQLDRRANEWFRTMRSWAKEEGPAADIREAAQEMLSGMLIKRNYGKKLGPSAAAMIMALAQSDASDELVTETEPLEAPDPEAEARLEAAYQLVEQLSANGYGESVTRLEPLEGDRVLSSRQLIAQ